MPAMRSAFLALSLVALVVSAASAAPPPGKGQGKPQGAEKAGTTEKAHGSHQSSPSVLPGDDHHHDDGDDHDGDDSGGCCRPRSKGWWHRQCLGSGDIRPGQGKGPGAHPQLDADELRRIIDRASRRAGSRCGSICEALDPQSARSSRSRAEAEYATFLLNREAGYLRGCDDADRRLAAAESDFDSGRWEECERRSGDVNGGRGVKRCDGDREEDDGDHRRDEQHREATAHGGGTTGDVDSKAKPAKTGETTGKDAPSSAKAKPTDKGKSGGKGKGGK